MVYHCIYTHLILSDVLSNQLSSDEKPQVDGGETITELTEGTEGDNELEGQRRKRWDSPAIVPWKSFSSFKTFSER